MMKWMCAGRIAWRPRAVSILPTGPSVGIGDAAGGSGGIALAVERDGVAHCLLGRAGDVERAEHRRLGRPRRLAVVDRVDQHRDAERVGEEDELLALVVGLLAGLGEVAY